MPVDDFSSAPPTKKQREEYEEEIAELSAELELYQKEYISKPAWLKAPKKQKEHHVTLVAFLSDTHYGEIVDPEELNGFNKYNIDVAEARTKQFFESTIELAETYLSGVKYDGIVLAMGGDIVSGDIHAELTDTNEISTYEAIEWSIPRIGDGIELFKKAFKKVHTVVCCGNHPRNTAKPRYKQRAVNNGDFHIGQLLAQRFNGDPDLTFHVPKSLDADFSVYDYRFTMEHGEEFRGGDGQVGAIGPVVRGYLRKQAQCSAEGNPFHYLMIGHFHQYVPAASKGFIMNGSLKGYDEFARGRHFKPEPPQQALSVVSPEYGISVQLPIFVDK